jgi:hypothetical protein
LEAAISLRGPQVHQIISPLDIFLWVYVKNMKYLEEIANLRTLRRRMTEAIAKVTEIMFVNT